MAELDKELSEYQDLMEVPSSFEDGFSFSSLIGTLFLALVMVPGSLYMGLVAGVGIGPAAKWVTVILFVEVAKRANAKLSRAQLFVLFYMSALIVTQTVHGTPLFRQFLAKSEAAITTGISALIPAWAAPLEQSAYDNRTFFQEPWIIPTLIIVFTMIFGKINEAILGYGLFRITSDIERLPFPMAPVAAQGIVAIAEDVEGAGSDNKSSIRWRAFCIGGAVGLIFGLIYMALPTLSGVFLGKTLMILPIPFVDLTSYTESYLPAADIGIGFNLLQLVFGMVMPFYAMLGSFVGLVAMWLANPILFYNGILTMWEPGDKMLEVFFKNRINLYLSLIIGMTFAVAFISIFGTLWSRKKRKIARLAEPPRTMVDRGDIPHAIVVIVYIISTLAYVLLSCYLLDWHKGVVIVLLIYGFLYTPIISYVTSRLEGMAGQVIQIPFIKEAAFILSGYRGVDIWFIPVPKTDNSINTIAYKQAELLGTKFTSLWKANFFLLPIVVLTAIFFSSFIWGLAPIPSAIYPYTQEVWDLEAKNACLIYSSTLGEFSDFEEALTAGKVGLGFGLGMVIFGVLKIFNAPALLFYGIIRGVSGGLAFTIVPQFVGAMLGRYYFLRKYGSDWRKFIPVFSAGFMVGAGLISMFCVGIVFLCRAISTLPY
ncbi:MAG: peptide transporter [Planctomycetes bacterium]|nr:peptide transporter [Planctomycetota bacterium]